MTLDQTILEIIEAETIIDQAALLVRLAARGHAVTQPTLSRHLRKLSIAKENGRYRRVERGVPERPPYALDSSPPNLLILKTAPGHAPLLGVLVDRIGIAEIAGSLAGDDTLFIALSADADLKAVRARIEAELD